MHGLQMLMQSVRPRVCSLYCSTYLHQRIRDNKHSTIGRHLEEHGLPKSGLEEKQVLVLKKCRSKFDCWIFVMLFILRPVLKELRHDILSLFLRGAK